MIRLRQNHQEKVGIASFLSSQNKIEPILFFLFILFLPTQFGKHFWPDFSIISGIRVDYLSPTLYFTDILIGLLFIFGLIRKIQSASWRTKFKIFNFKLLTCLLIFLVINIFLSNNIYNGFYHLLKFLEFLFVGFYVATQINNLEKLRNTFFFLAIGGIFESLLAILQFINQGSLGGLFYFLGERTFNSSTPGIANASINGELLLRPYATFSHPNVLAGFLLCVMLFILLTFPLSRRGPAARHPRPTSSRSLRALDGDPPLASPLLRFIWTLALFLGTSALILTMSRVAIVLWMLIIIFSIYHFSKKNKWRALVVIFLLVGVFVATPFGPRLISTRLTEEAVVQRQELIISSFKLFTTHPVFGVGLGNLLPSLATIQKPLSTNLYLQPVHNVSLLVLAETGIIGLGFFVWFLIRTYKYLLSNLKTHAIFLVSLIAVLILGLFDHYFLTLQQGQILFAVVLGLCWTHFAHRT